MGTPVVDANAEREKTRREVFPRYEREREREREKIVR